jgi:hypothetical protein
VHFHLCHVIPDDRRFHGLNGHLEVIETVRWGLEALGHGVSVAKNSTVPGAVNIIFGFQALNEAAASALPPDSIVYNLEQIAHAPPEAMPPIAQYAAKHLRIWDYSSRNLQVWRALHPNCQPRLVPIGYAPGLTRIAKREEEIDVLFYGMPSEARLTVFGEICSAGLSAVFACGLYGCPRDELIARAKVVLNLNLYAGKIFEIVRVSYLLANAKTVVANTYPGLEVEPDVGQAVMLVPPEQIVQTCLSLVEDNAARRSLEQRGLEAMRRRDVRQVLLQILGG